ncbi:hypothetical protein [Chromobacterium sp. ASV23]|uniref:hypothetical protein n=1 Tax=Chromobacterium sp. ASV23 TaxID=2795110 RepID=UPI001E5BBB98|nr:hypothetical protein [Chromobacterium sp. ASV23]
MSGQNEGQVPKIHDSLIGKGGTVVDYDYFINEKMSKKKLSSVDKSNLIKFIDVNLSILSGASSVDAVNKSDPNTKIELFVPKLPQDPIISASTYYTYIIKMPTQTSKGEVGDFLSSLKRKNESAPWEYAYIPIRNGFNIPTFTNFSKEDFEKLHLSASEKFFLSDLESKKHAVDFYQDSDFKKFYDYGDNGANFAFYKFTTTRNSIPLSVVFGVLEDQYDESAEFPSNWFYVYMKREG